jgi:hypothetical protein
MVLNLPSEKRPKGRPKGKKESYTYDKSSVYWKSVGGVDVRKAVNLYLKTNGGTLNDLIHQALYEKLKREGFIKK